MRATVPGLVALLAAMLLAACGNHVTPTAPTAVDAPRGAAPLPPVSGPSGHFQVTDGWTGRPVTEVTVWLGETIQPVAPDGRVAVETPGCTRARFVAPGYLERVVVCVQALIARGEAATLWPVATAAEAEATREAVFTGLQRLAGFYSPEFHFEPDLAGRADVVAAWTAANDRLSAATGGEVRAAFLQDPPTDGFVVSLGTGPSACTSSFFSWTFAAAGFCWGPWMGYFVQVMPVDAQRVADPSVALRALLHGAGMRPHQLPGLFNATAPADELSEFERRTMHMARQRSRLTVFPGSVRWPDIECPSLGLSC